MKTIITILALAFTINFSIAQKKSAMDGSSILRK